MTTRLTQDDVQRMAANPSAALAQLAKADAEDSFIDFVRLGWSVVEPQRPFVRGWVMDAMAEHLEAVTRGQIRKLLVNVPPGFAKSLFTSVFWPAWEWGPRNMPSMRYVCASYSEALTIRDNVRTRLLLKAPFYQENWGDRFSFMADQDAKMKFANDKTGFKLATSVGGVGTGERGDRVIIDDPHNVLEAESDAKRENVLQWFTEVLPTRVNDPERAVFVVIMQRVHELDVSGLILAKELGFEHLCVPMRFEEDHPFAAKRKSTLGWRDPRKKEGDLAFPQRYSKDAVWEMEHAMMSWGGTYAVAGQMQQRPEPRGGGMIKQEWLEFVDDLPEDDVFVWARGWDFAGTEGGGDGSACVKTGISLVTGDIWVVDARWRQVSSGGLITMIQECLAEDGVETFQSMPQDPGQAGKYQSGDLANLLQGYDFEFTLETGEKEVRFRPFAAQCEVRFNANRRVKVLRRNWNGLYLDQILKFPRGRYKDIPDAQSRSYGAAAVRLGSGFSGSVGGSTLIEG